jgi:hypothetical protein
VFKRIRGLFGRRPTPDPQAAAEAATVLAMGTQSGIAAVPGTAFIPPEPVGADEDKPRSESEGAV